MSNLDFIFKCLYTVSDVDYYYKDYQIKFWEQ